LIFHRIFSELLLLEFGRETCKEKYHYEIYFLFFKQILTNAERLYFFEETLPKIIKLAMKLPHLITQVCSYFISLGHRKGFIVRQICLSNIVEQENLRAVIFGTIITKNL
jgi:hypothetical protein